MEPLDLTRFDTTDMMRCRSALRGLKEDAGGSMESMSRKVVDYFFETLQGGDGLRGSVLVRMFKTACCRSMADGCLNKAAVDETAISYQLSAFSFQERIFVSVS